METETDIEVLCRKKEQELLDRYFGNLAKEAAIDRPETIGDYTQDLPAKIEAEYRTYLEGLWRRYSDHPLVLEEQKLRSLMTERQREALDKAHKDADHITLWERVTKTNHQDVTHYKGLLRAYTKDLLTLMRLDFLEEVTGRHITAKAFEE